VFSPEIVPSEEKLVPLKESLLSLFRLWPLALIMIACVGPIYAGLQLRPNRQESERRLDHHRFLLREASIKITLAVRQGDTKVTCMLFFIIIGAMTMSTAISQLGLPRQVIEWIGGPHRAAGRHQWLRSILLYIILGCLFDGISMMVMTLPFVFPIVLHLGYDAIWFGVMMCLLIEIGMVDTPGGMNLFMVQAVAGEKHNDRTDFRGSIPFLVCCLIVLIIITFVPATVTWLPSVITR